MFDGQTAKRDFDRKAKEYARQLTDRVMLSDGMEFLDKSVVTHSADEALRLVGELIATPMFAEFATEGTAWAIERFADEKFSVLCGALFTHFTVMGSPVYRNRFLNMVRVAYAPHVYEHLHKVEAKIDEFAADDMVSLVYAARIELANRCCILFALHVASTLTLNVEWERIAAESVKKSLDQHKPGKGCAGAILGIVTLAALALWMIY